MLINCLKLILILLPLLSVAVQCRPLDLLTSYSASPSPTPNPRLISPIQPGDGSDLIDRLLEKGTIRVGIRVWPEPEFAPPAFRGLTNAQTGGALNGFEIDVARLIAYGLGLELELIEADPRVINSSDWRDGWDIALASLVPFDQPLKDMPASNIVYSVPYGYIPMAILIPAAEDDPQTLPELLGRRVGVLEHSAYQRLLTLAELPLTVQDQPLMPAPPQTLQLVVLSNLSKAIRELGQVDPAGRQVDAIFGPAPVLQAAVEQDFPVKLAAGAKNLGAQPLVIAAAPQDDLKVDRLISEINHLLLRLQQQGLLAEVYFRWYKQDFSQIH